MQQLAVTIEESQQIDPAVLRQCGNVGTMGLNKTRIALLDKSIGFIPNSPIVRQIVESIQFTLDASESSIIIFIGFYPFQLIKCGLNKPQIDTFEGAKHQCETCQNQQGGLSLAVFPEERRKSIHFYPFIKNQ